MTSRTGVGRSGADERRQDPTRPGAGERKSESLGLYGVINSDHP